MQNVTHFLCFNRLEYRIRTQVQKFDFHFLYSVLGKEGGPGGQRPCLGRSRTVHQCAPALMSFNLQEKVTTKRETVLPLYQPALQNLKSLSKILEATTFRTKTYTVGKNLEKISLFLFTIFSKSLNKNRFLESWILAPKIKNSWWDNFWNFYTVWRGDNDASCMKM